MNWKDGPPDDFDIANMTAYDVALWQERILNFVKRSAADSAMSLSLASRLGAQSSRIEELTQTETNLKADLKAAREALVVADSYREAAEHREADAETRAMHAERDLKLSQMGANELAAEHKALLARHEALDRNYTALFEKYQARMEGRPLETAAPPLRASLQKLLRVLALYVDTSVPSPHRSSIINALAELQEALS